jgi:hypothetical protein
VPPPEPFKLSRAAALEPPAAERLDLHCGGVEVIHD